MEIQTTSGIAVLPMRAGKANAIGSAFLDRLSAQLDAVESSRASALVLTGEGTAFSAGLDLPELAGLDRSGLERFIRRFSEVMLRVFTLPVPVVAAINGHAIAGGCVLALQADVRLAAAGDYRIGLNEVQIGLGLPAVVLETLRCQVSPASLSPVALEGRLLAPEEALGFGLVEAVVPPPGQPGFAKLLDLEMLVLTPRGRERTENEFAALFERGGFQLTRVVPTPSAVCVVEGART